MFDVRVKDASWITRKRLALHQTDTPAMRTSTELASSTGSHSYALLWLQCSTRLVPYSWMGCMMRASCSARTSATR